MQILTDWSLNLDLDLVLRWQGVNPDRARQRNSPLLRVATEALQLGKPLIQPAAFVEILPVEKVTHEKIQLTGGGILSGSAVTRFLGPAQEIALIICTIGDQLELLISEAMKSEPGLGLSLDGLANGAVENLGTEVCRYYEHAATQRGWQCSLPVSPGMDGWPLEMAQAQVFSFLDASQVNVQLTRSAVMVPLKSASMVLGMGPDPFLQGAPCDFCNLQEICRYREQRADQ